MLLRSALARSSARLATQARWGRKNWRLLHSSPLARSRACSARSSAPTKTRLLSSLKPHPLHPQQPRQTPLRPRQVRFSSTVGDNNNNNNSDEAASENPAPGDSNSTTDTLPLIVDVDASNIEQVMVQSFGVPTILDCHAEWCNPCKQLAPILEDVVKRANGKLRLAKLDVDLNKELAAQLRVQSLPTVFGIAKSKVVDQFIGLPQQDKFQAFVDNLLSQGADAAAGPGAGLAEEAPRTPEAIMDTGLQAMRSGDFQSAKNNFETVIALEESDAEAIEAAKQKSGARNAPPKTEEQAKLQEMAAVAQATLCQVLLLSGAEADAMDLAARIKDEPKWAQHVDNPKVAQPLAIVSLYGGAGDFSVDPQDIEERLTSNEQDHEARFALATGLILQGNHEQALNEAFQIVRADKDWEGGRARKFCVDIFNALGNEHPLVVKGRRRLSNLLF